MHFQFYRLVIRVEILLNRFVVLIDASQCIQYMGSISLTHYTRIEGLSVLTYYHNAMLTDCITR